MAIIMIKGDDNDDGGEGIKTGARSVDGEQTARRKGGQAGVGEDGVVDPVVLVHGVFGENKTRVWMHLLPRWNVDAWHAISCWWYSHGAATYHELGPPPAWTSRFPAP